MLLKGLAATLARKNIKKTVYMHIGAPKTATTSIQHQLLDSSRELSRIGFEYCCNSYKLGASLTSHCPISNKKLELLISDWELELKSSTQPNLIISSESLYGDFYDPLRTTEDIARNLKSVFSNYNVIIVFVAREQLAFHRSLYNQSIKEGSTKTYLQFCKDVSIFNFDWLKVADTYAKYFGANALKCFWYEDLLSESHSPAETLLSLLGRRKTPVRFSSNGSKTNVSLGSFGTEILRSINGLLSDPQRIKLWTFLGMDKEFQDSEFYSYFLSQEQMHEAMSFYSESNKAFTRKYVRNPQNA